MSLPVRLAQALVNAAWRATHRQKAIGHRGSGTTPGSGGWFNLVREPFTGAWQRNVEWRTDQVLTYSAVFRCIALIASDVAKMRIRLVEQDSNGIWQETRNAAHSPVLRKPNRYMNRIQFFTNWMESKLIHGNTYVLKERDERNVVARLYVLHPELITVLVAPDGAVYYDLRSDDLAGVRQSIVVPASEIIHDRWNTINHPLVGTSPIHACGLAATQGLKIQEGSTKFFANGNRPSGVVTVPTDISKDKADELKQIWDTRPSGTTAVLTSGMQYTPMSITAADAQLLEQLKWTAETVASVFGVPAFKIGVGTAPTYNNIEALDAQYYSQCLQIHIESIELALDEGLELKGNLGTEFDLDDLLRMDTATMVKAAAEGVKAGIMSPNEARMKFSLKPVDGGESPYLQEQNWPLRLLSNRELPARPPTEPEEIVSDGDGGDDGEQDGEDTSDSEERQRNLISFAEAKIERFAREHERRHSA